MVQVSKLWPSLDITTKKYGLLWQAKTAAKGPFGLLWWGLVQRFHLPTLHNRNSSIMAVTKNAVINAPFSGIFGFLQWVENHCHMLSEFVSLDF